MWSLKVEQAFDAPGLAEEIDSAILEKKWLREWKAFWEANKFLIDLESFPEELILSAWYGTYLHEGQRPTWHKIFPELCLILENNEKQLDN